MKNMMMIVLAVALSAGVGNAIELAGVGAKEAAVLARELNVPAEVPAPVSADRDRKAAKPITKAVSFKSPAFAELLVNSLKIKPELVIMAGGQSYVYKVGNGLVCYKSFVTDIQLPNEPRKAVYSCSILPEGGWKFMGMEGHGSGDNRDFSLALYAAMNAKAANEGGMKIKALALDLPGHNGGTERNLLSCMNPGPEVAALGFRPACEFINGVWEISI